MLRWKSHSGEKHCFYILKTIEYKIPSDLYWLTSLSSSFSCLSPALPLFCLTNLSTKKNISHNFFFLSPFSHYYYRYLSFHHRKMVLLFFMHTSHVAPVRRASERSEKSEIPWRKLRQNRNGLASAILSIRNIVALRPLYAVEIANCLVLIFRLSFNARNVNFMIISTCFYSSRG